MKRPAALDRLKQLHEQATGPGWDMTVDANDEDEITGPTGEVIGTMPQWDDAPEQQAANRELIPAMRNALPDILAYGEHLDQRIKDLEESLRSMVTVYVGVVQDHLSEYNRRHVLEEPPVKRARILLGLDTEPQDHQNRIT